MGSLLILDIGGGELMLILVVVLIFFGSKGIPGIARTLGRTMRQIRDASAEVQREIQRGAQDVRQEVEQQRRSFQPDETPVRPTLPKSAPDVDTSDAGVGEAKSE